MKVFGATVREGEGIERGLLVIEREERGMKNDSAVMFEVEVGKRREKIEKSLSLIEVRRWRRIVCPLIH